MRSMTGFGRAVAQNAGRRLTVELKSVNNRFLDLSFRMPRGLQFLEQELRGRLALSLSRGRVDVNLQYLNHAPNARRVEVDESLLSAYGKAVEALRGRLPLEPTMRIGDLFLVPDAISIREEEDEDALRALAFEGLDAALGELVSAREREGAALQQDLGTYLAELISLQEEMACLAPQQPVLHRKRLEQRLLEAQVEGLEPQRLAQEVALLVDRSAVDEELARLSAHLLQMQKLLHEDGALGRQMDFLAQEMHREINTIGSKSAMLQLSRAVLQAKNTLEKLREQVQNIE